MIEHDVPCVMHFSFQSEVEAIAFETVYIFDWGVNHMLLISGYWFAVLGTIKC
jgi:hypothetical protein